jgi:geranylgeranyl pyrophosphate synthase
VTSGADSGLLARERAEVEPTLRRVLSPQDRWPARLHDAMGYAVLGGGKRIRPILARLAYASSGGDPGEITAAACGLELIHTYSLIHDDLPCMDDDVLRRGRSTVHVAFDEATAVLAGDALLAEGLLLLASRPEGPRWAERRAVATAVVAEAVSSRGMVGGQMADLEATGRVGQSDTADGEQLERIHRAKTGALIRASVELGAVLAGVEDRESFVAFGDRLGLAFQVADDLLDATATSVDLGKTPGKDAKAGKLTFVSLYGLDETRRRLTALEAELTELAEGIEGPGGALAAVASYVIHRTS